MARPSRHLALVFTRAPGKVGESGLERGRSHQVLGDEPGHLVPVAHHGRVRAPTSPFRPAAGVKEELIPLDATSTMSSFFSSKSAMEPAGVLVLRSIHSS